MFTKIRRCKSVPLLVSQPLASNCTVSHWHLIVLISTHLVQQDQEKNYLYCTAHATPQRNAHLIHPWVLETVNEPLRASTGSHLHLFDEAAHKWSHGFDNFLLKGTLGKIRRIGLNHVVFQIFVDEYQEYCGQVDIINSESTVAIPKAYVIGNCYRNHKLEVFEAPVRNWTFWYNYHPHKAKLDKWRSTSRF